MGVRIKFLKINGKELGRIWREGRDRLFGGQAEKAELGAENGQGFPRTLRLLSAELRKQLSNKWSHPKIIAVSETAFGS